jgi:peptide chain release factor 1
MRDGFTSLRVAGKDASTVFADEAGGHRWQRIPPNEKRGRVHTSTVTIAILPEPTEVELHLRPEDLDWKFSRGSGAGGQKRNVTSSAVDLTHLPTNTRVHAESERSLTDNKRCALASLRARLWEAEKAKVDRERAVSRRDQVGTGQRGDKVLTVRCQDAIVSWHILGKKQSLRDYLEGKHPGE